MGHEEHRLIGGAGRVDHDVAAAQGSRHPQRRVAGLFGRLLAQLLDMVSEVFEEPVRGREQVVERGQLIDADGDRVDAFQHPLEMVETVHDRGDAGADLVGGGVSGRRVVMLLFLVFPARGGGLGLVVLDEDGEGAGQAQDRVTHHVSRRGRGAAPPQGSQGGHPWGGAVYGAPPPGGPSLPASPGGGAEPVDT
ncbi:hypothetical protein [Salinactinospora qingdaonensis]